MKLFSINHRQRKEFFREFIVLFGTVLTFGAVEVFQNIFPILKNQLVSILAMILSILIVIISKSFVDKFLSPDSFFNNMFDNFLKRIGLITFFMSVKNLDFIISFYQNNPILTYILGIVIVTSANYIVGNIFDGGK